MKPAPFEYVRAESVAQALDALGAEDARVLAGGQSLVPLMNLRLARPAVLVDVNPVSQLNGVNVNGELRLGALVRHRTLEGSAEIREFAPLLARAAALIGHPAVRNRGTLGGTLAHADPVAELPAAMVALEASIVVTGPVGTRTVPAVEFFEGMFATAVGPGEMVTEAVVPVASAGETSAFVEFAEREGDFAIVGIASRITRDPDGTCTAVRLAGCGLGPKPVDLSDAAADLLGQRELPTSLLRTFARTVGASVQPSLDIHATAEDRRELAKLLAVNAVRAAWNTSPGGQDAG